MEISAIILLIFLGMVGIAMLVAVFKKQFKEKGATRSIFLIFGIALLAYGLVGLGGQAGLYEIPGTAGTFFLTTTVVNEGSGEIVCPAGTTLQNGICVSTTGGGATYQPTASYSARDKYSTTSVSGTSYYKVNGNSATTTAYTNVNVGDQITYWVENTSYWVKPVTKNAGAGVNPFEALGWSNSTATVTLYDSVNRQSVTDGAYNTSMGANDQANIEITYQGTAEGSAGPFGGKMVIEMNSTISSVICNGDVLMPNDNYHLTYTTSATTHTYKSWAYGPSLDDGSGAVKRIDCQFKNGATAVGAGSVYYVKFIPANYYVTNNGDIVLDTEKYADGDTTRTGSTINLPTASAYWGS
jgi:hypothetical protein